MASYNNHDVCILDFRAYKQTVDPGNSLQNLSPFPTYHVLAEGDSWFHFVGATGFAREKNIVDAMNFKNQLTAVANLARIGDTIKHITDTLLDGELEAAIKYRKWNLILLSAGGNDLLDALIETKGYNVGGTTLSILQPSASPVNAKSFINQAHVDLFKTHIKDCFMKFNGYKSASINASTPVLLHTYDYPTPNNAKAKCLGASGGPWLYSALNAKGVPTTYWKEISDYVLDELNAALLGLNGVAKFNVVDTRNTLVRAATNQTGNSNDWLNETHPNAHGFKKLGEKLSQAIVSKNLIP